MCSKPSPVLCSFQPYREHHPSFVSWNPWNPRRDPNLSCSWMPQQLTESVSGYTEKLLSTPVLPICGQE